MLRIKKIIPNTLTSLNLFCGCLGIVFTFNNQLEYAAAMIWIAGVFDFLDGFSARILKVNSEIGKQLDSLADMVTFGVLPGMILYQMILSVNSGINYIAYLAFLIVIFSAVRLAKFNIDTEQSNTFIGLPTPANAFCVSAFPYILSDLSIFTNQQLLILLITYILLFSWLLIADIKMLALKFKSFGWSNNEVRWIFIIVSLILIFILQISAIPAIISLYILISIINNKVLNNI